MRSKSPNLFSIVFSWPGLRMVSTTTCEVEILQSRLPFSKRRGNPLGGVRADQDCFGWLAMTMNCRDRAAALAEAISRDIAIEGGRCATIGTARGRSDP